MPLSVAVLHYPDFRRLLTLRVMGLMALQAQAVIIGWQIYSLTHSAVMLGLTGLVEAVPAIFGAFVSGHMVDHARPHAIYWRCIGILVLNMAFLAVVGGGWLPLPDGWTVPLLFLGVFISGIARSFIMPCSATLLAQIVPREQIAGAAAWLSSGFHIGAMTGPAVAGLLYGMAGARMAWCMPLLLIGVAFGAILSMSPPVRHYRNANVREPMLQSIRAGWAYLFGQPTLLSVMALDMFAVLFGGAVAVLPMVADQLLHVGSEGLGLLRAAPAAGAVIVALTLALRPLKVIRATTLIAMVTGFGLCMIGFALSPFFWLSFAFLAMSGAFDAVSMVMRQTLMQLLTTDAVRGRISAVNSMFIISSNELGAFESGMAARVMGLVPSLIFGGGMTLLVAASSAALSPSFRRTVVHTGNAPQGV